MEKTCQDRVNARLKSRLQDLSKLWKAYSEGNEDKYSDELGNIFEYGLCFDYVAQDTFDDQKEGYFRYQLSWGGPSDEFRFYCNLDYTPYKTEYWFLDWFDGASVDVTDNQLLQDLFDWFKDCGTVEAKLEEVCNEY